MLPAPAVEALRAHRVRQADGRLLAGPLWHEVHPELGGLVFASAVGTPMPPANVRRAFTALRARAGLRGPWTPYHLRHAAVSLLSDEGVSPEAIADLLGHVDTRMVSSGCTGTP